MQKKKAYQPTLTFGMILKPRRCFVWLQGRERDRQIERGREKEREKKREGVRHPRKKSVCTRVRLRTDICERGKAVARLKLHDSKVLLKCILVTKGRLRGRVWVRAFPDCVTLQYLVDSKF